MKNIDLTIGEPGTGKSHSLVTNALSDMKRLGGSVFISVPTHASAQNIRAIIYKEMNGAKEGDKLALKQLLKAVHVLEDKYNGEEVVYIDEIGQWTPSYFNSLLLKLQSVPAYNLHLSGDIRQLQPVKGFSPLEDLLRKNLDIDDFWQWVSQNAYEEFTLKNLHAPSLWRVEEIILVKLLEKNYRLNALGYSQYDNDFFNDVVANKVIELPDYTEQITQAVNNYSAILVPTKQRGNEVNEIILNALGNMMEYQQWAPFIEVDKSTYLNPYHKELDRLKKEFSGVPLVDEDVSLQNITFKYWATVHSMQGITVRSVTFYMGNAPIMNGHKSHYSQNLLYTSLTRASDEIVLLGLVSSFKEMRGIIPTTPQDTYGKFKAEQAKVELFNKLRLDTLENKKSFSEVYSLYTDIFKGLAEPSEVVANSDVYQINYEMYSAHELALKFADYPISEAITEGFKPDYTQFNKAERAKVNSGNGSKKRGKGKTQVWIESLDDVPKQEVLKATQNLSVRKFKEAYGFDKRQVLKALGA